MATTKKERGSRLSLYDKVYRELDATMIGAERQRNVDAHGETRYDMYEELGVGYNSNKDYCITVRADTRDRLNLAERIAQYYGAEYEIKEFLYKHDPMDRYKIFISVEE